MCNSGCIIFGASNLWGSELKGKRVIELGSMDFNGSLRKILSRWEPSEYIGIDIEAGPGVDIVCGVEDAVERFGRDSFDVVVSTEMLEHARDWRKAITNIKNLCRPGGIMLLTTRSVGFPVHSYPYDFWRYGADDMRAIFSDCVIEKIEEDRPDPGIFLKARKPAAFLENDLSGYELYSIITRKRVRELDDAAVRRFQRSYVRYRKLKAIASAAWRFIESRVLRA